MNTLDQDLLRAARTGDADAARTAIEGGARADARDEERRGFAEIAALLRNRDPR
ncbi:hypothetical protein [Streptomyces sp900116325]|uniref:hypothetical protein n=1 Tax=unclassified Streptomyces TaxID=2593676 RepID=UPI0033BEC064